MVPASLTLFLASPVVGLLARRIPARRLLAMGLGLAAFATAGLATWHGSVLLFELELMGYGLGAALAFPAMPMLIGTAVPRHVAASALAVNNVSKTVGAAVGAQVGAAILVAHTMSGTGAVSEQAFAFAFGASAGAAALGAISALLIRRATSEKGEVRLGGAPRPSEAV